jgi:hypothetical protein
MEELSHPVELSDAELDLVAAAGGCGCPLIAVDVDVFAPVVIVIT